MIRSSGRPKGRKNNKLSKDDAFIQSIEANLKAIKTITGLYMNGDIPKNKLEDIKDILADMNKVLDAPATQKQIEVIKALREQKTNEDIQYYLEHSNAATV